MNSLRREVYSTLLVATVPIALVSVFPYRAVSFRAKAVSANRPASAAFVILDADTERSAVRAAKSSWHGDAVGAPSYRAVLPVGELPDAPSEPVLGAWAHVRTPDPAPPAFEYPPYLPSCRAPSYGRIAPAPQEKRAPAFPREELLRLP